MKQNGVITCRKLRQIHGCETPIIFSSANDNEEHKILFQNAGGTDFIGKP